MMRSTIQAVPNTQFVCVPVYTHHPSHLTPHYLVYRKNSQQVPVQDPKTKGMSLCEEGFLFVVNVDTSAGTQGAARDLRSFFSQFGPVRSITIGHLSHLNTKDNSVLAQHARGLQWQKSLGQPSIAEAGRCAFANVTFHKEKSLDKAMRVGQTVVSGSGDKAPGDEESESPSVVAESASSEAGLQGFVQRYISMRRVPAQLMAEVDRFMKNYEKFEESEKRRLASMRGVPDADGFITVLPSKRSAHAAGGGGEDTEDLDELEALASGKPVKKKSKKEAHVQDFYRFQRRERKREQLADLRRKFEEDKARIARLKGERKFKPF